MLGLLPPIIGMRVALATFVAVNEGWVLALGFDMRNQVRLVLALLLFLAAVGPACLIMSPAMAMANDAPSRDCTEPGAPAAGCPHATAAKAAQPADLASDAAPTVVAVSAPILPVADEAVFADAAGSLALRPPAHLTPLRL